MINKIIGMTWQSLAGGYCSMIIGVLQFCSEDGLRDDGGDSPCSVRCSVGVCLTGVGPNLGSGLAGRPGFRC